MILKHREIMIKYDLDSGNKTQWSNTQNKMVEKKKSFIVIKLN